MIIICFALSNVKCKFQIHRKGGRSYCAVYGMSCQAVSASVSGFYFGGMILRPVFVRGFGIV
nr:MAG TPA: hypothetical protein [Caudoviricetes sp.]